MAVLAGYGGDFDFGALLDSDLSFSVHSWSVDVSAEAHDTTDFSTSGWRRFLSGLKGWTGSAELYTDGTYHLYPSDVGVEATAKLYFSDVHYLTGKCFLTTWSPSVSVDGVETQTISIQGSSDLTYA